MTQEIKARDWKTFCERVTETQKGQAITVELVDRNGGERELSRAVSLESVKLAKKDACNDAITIATAEGYQHEVLEPIHVILKGNGEGGFNFVQIDGETGITLLTFRPALKPNILDGLGDA